MTVAADALNAKLNMKPAKLSLKGFHFIKRQNFITTPKYQINLLIKSFIKVTNLNYPIN
jgi:hypothetical protein